MKMLDCGHEIPDGEHYHTTGYPVKTLCDKCAHTSPALEEAKPVSSLAKRAITKGIEWKKNTVLPLTKCGTAANEGAEDGGASAPINAESSKGRTTGFEPVNVGSSPASAGEQGISSPKPLSPSSVPISRVESQANMLLQVQIIQRIEKKVLPLLGEDFESAEEISALYSPWELNQLMTEALVNTGKTSFIYTCVLLAVNSQNAYYSQTGHETFDNYLDHLELDRSQKSRFLCIGNAVLGGVLKLDDALAIPKSNLNLLTPLLRQSVVAQQQITPELIEQAKTLDFNGMRLALGQEVKKPEGDDYRVCPRCGEIFLIAEAKKAKKGE